MTQRRRQRGATLVEGAIIVLVFFVLLIGILEFGRAYNLYQVLTNAAREGARFAVAPCSLNPSSCSYGAGVLPTNSDIVSKVEAYLSTAHIQTPPATVAVAITSVPIVTRYDPSSPTTTSIGATQVNVTAPYTFLFFKDFGTITIHAQAVMRNETD